MIAINWFTATSPFSLNAKFCRKWYPVVSLSLSLSLGKMRIQRESFIVWFSNQLMIYAANWDISDNFVGLPNPRTKERERASVIRVERGHKSSSCFVQTDGLLNWSSRQVGRTCGLIHRYALPRASNIKKVARKLSFFIFAVMYVQIK